MSLVPKKREEITIYEYEVAKASENYQRRKAERKNTRTNKTIAIFTYITWS